MTLDTLILILSILVVSNYMFRHSVLYPPFLFCGMWLLDILVYRLNVIEIYSLHRDTLYVILAGSVLFSIGGAAAFFVPSILIKRRLTLIGNVRSNSNIFKIVIVALMAICVCLSIRQAMHVAAASGAGGLFIAAARNAVIENIRAGRGAISWYSYVSTWSIFVAVLFLAERSDKPAHFAIGIAFISNALGGGRTGLLALFSALVCVYLLKSETESFKSSIGFVRWPILGFVLLFSGMIFADKSIGTDDVSVASFAGTMLVRYIISPTAALDHVLTHLSDYSGQADHTFQFFLRIISSFHIIAYIPPPALDKWIFVPFGTNVYTYYRFIVTDFGVPVALFLTALVGFLHSLLFRKAHTRSTLSVYLFAVSIYSVLMVTFDDAYSRFGMYFSACIFATFYLAIQSVPWKIFSPKDALIKSAEEYSAL